jgi:LysM repeat protein
MLEQKTSSRARVRIAVFFVLSIHVIALMALLMQGCRKPVEQGGESVTNAVPTFETTPSPAPDTNALATNATGMAPSEPVPTPANRAAVTEYTVTKGDSFYTIAKKFGVTVKAIAAANPGIEPTKLQIGQKLQIPAAPATSAEPAVTPGALEMGRSGEQVYTVKSGDTLTKIASQFGTTIKALRSANNLETDKIKVGQKLKIPSPSSSPAAPPAPAPAPAAPTNTTA